MYTKQEIGYIKEFCSTISEIVIPEQLDIVEQTAIAELKKFLEEAPLTGQKKLVIGQKNNSDQIRALDEKGELTIHTISAEDDAFEIKCIGETIVIAGANPRGVLYGVYELEDLILNGQTEQPSAFCVPHFRKRTDALGHYHNRDTFNFETDVIDDKKAEYLARLRVNQICVCCDGSPYGNHICEFVKSDVFPFQRDPSPNAVSKLKAVSKLMAKYGIDFVLQIWEPAVPQLFASLDQYPPEVLGTVKRPWGGDENHMDHTLCMNSPLVQEHYRNIVTKFVQEYPEVKGFLLYNMDGRSWLCTPELCPRCAENLIDSDPSIHNPWETQAKLINIIIESAHAADPNFKFTFWGPVHFSGEAVHKLYENVKDYDYVMTGAAGGDHDMYISNKEEPCYEVLETIRAAKKFNAPSSVYYAFNKLEAIQTGFPNPFIVASSLKTFKNWGIDGITELTGPTPALNQINALAMKKFESEPDTDMDTWLTWLAEKQFGKEAGKLMYQAWEHNRDAFDCWKGYTDHPFLGSHFVTRLGLMPNDGTFNYGGGTPSIDPTLLDEFDFLQENGIDLYQNIKTPEYVERYIAMGKCLAKAEEAAKAAADAASDDFVGICYYSGAFEGIERHTMKEYAKLNLTAIQIAHSMCTQKIHMFQALTLLRDMRDGGKTAEENLKADYLKLVEDEIGVQNSFKVLLEKFARQRPCLAMTGMCESELRDYIDFTEKRLEKLTNYFASTK